MNQNFSTKKNEKAQGLVEYALLAALVGLVVSGALMAFGPSIKVVALNLMGSTSNGLSVEDGELIIPDINSTSTPTGSPTPTDSLISTVTFTPTNSLTPTPTNSPTSTPIIASTSTPTRTPIIAWTPTPTWTPVVIATSTPNELACTPGKAYNVKNKSACKDLSIINNCSSDNIKYDWGKKICTWWN